MRAGASGLPASQLLGPRQELRTPKSRLEGGGLGVQALAWDVSATGVRELGATAQSPGCLKGMGALTTDWDVWLVVTRIPGS